MAHTELANGVEDMTVNEPAAAPTKGPSKKELKKQKKKEEFLKLVGDVKPDTATTEPNEEDALKNFSLSCTQRTGAAALMENSLDIRVDKFSINAAGRTLFTNAELHITNGRKYGLVGPNGHGKTTLLRHIVERKMQIPSSIDMLLCEQDVQQTNLTAFNYVLQSDKDRMQRLKEVETYQAKFDETGDMEYMEKVNKAYEELDAMKADAAAGKARRLLCGLGFTDKMMDKKTCDMSGGWRMRVSLARALFLEPTLLMLDEPTNHLDLNAVIWLDNYLQGWKKTLLIVSHDQSFLDNVCTDIIHLNQKKLNYYRGNYETFKRMVVQKHREDIKEYEKQERRLKELKKAGKSSKEAERRQKDTLAKKNDKGKNKNQKKAAQEDSDEGPQELLERPKEYVVKFNFPATTDVSPPILGLHDVSFHYPGCDGQWLFKDLDFGVDMNSRICIVGPNGVGKSTFLKLLTGDVEPTRGERRLNHRVKLGKFDQHSSDQLRMDVTPTQYLQDTYNLRYQEARATLGRFGLESSAHTVLVRDLSGGQRTRVAFADLSCKKPDLLILDEPTNNLDIESIDALGLALNAYTGGVILVSHDERLIRDANCSLYVVEEKSVNELDGAFDDYRREILEALGEEVMNPSLVAAAAGCL